MSKEIKNALKEAREAIKNKDFKVAQKQCKWILSEHADNYMALVLLGVALQDSDANQACESFRKAASVDASQLLAWQGLMSCLEKKSIPDAELAGVYGKLMILDKGKFADLCSKLISFGYRLPSPAPCIDALQHVNKSLKDSEDGSGEKYSSVVHLSIAKLILAMNEVPQEYHELLDKSLSVFINDPAVEDHRDLSQRYLKHLYRTQRLHQVVERCKVMHHQYPQDQYPLEYMCKVYIELSLDELDPDLSSQDLNLYCDSLLNLNNSSTMALLARSVDRLLRDMIIEARDIAVQVSKLRQGWLHCIYTLARCHYHLGAYNLCEQCCQQALTSTSISRTIKLNLEVMLVDSLVKQGSPAKLKTALEKCVQLLSNAPDNKKILFIRTEALILLNEESETIQKDLNTLGDYERAILNNLVLKKTKDYRNGLKTLANVQNISLEQKQESRVWIEIGKLYKLLNQSDDSLVPFLKAAKLDPYSAEVFYELGDCYFRSGNSERAKKCLQKSLQMSPQQSKAGSLLSKLYRKDNESDLNIALLENAASSKTVETKWAWLQLGLHHLSKGDYDSSIDSLRTVVRLDPHDPQCWESLADAYLNRGSYLSAQRSYLRVLELTSSLYAKLRIANIDQSLGLYTNAIKWYNQVVAEDENYLLALKGLGETYYHMAKQYFSQRRLALCREYAQKSIDYMIKAVMNKNNISCLYRQIANDIILVVTLPDKYVWLNIPLCLTGSGTKEIYKKQQLLELSTKCYVQALKLSENNDFIWHELSISYYETARHLQVLKTDKCQAMLMYDKCIASAKLAVEKAPNRWQHWNLLGYVSCNKTINRQRLGQHCFIKAVTLNPDAATAWTNLGMLYLKNKEIILANKAFARAQQSDPRYVNSWVGQSYIAQSQDHKETMDLFRHCVQLSYHPQSALAYANFVCETLTNKQKMADAYYHFAIYDMHAITLAIDNITWYLEAIGWAADDDDFQLQEETETAWGLKRSNVIRAFIILGHLQSMEKHYSTAKAAFTTAVKLADGMIKDTVLVNLAKSYLKLSNPQKALELLEQVNEASYKSACCLAQAYYKVEMYEECFGVYESALDWLSEGDFEKSQIIVCMARLAYAFQGPDETKTLLFQCLNVNPPCLAALYAACALGIIHKDNMLSELILHELDQHKHNPDCVYNTAFLKAQYNKSQDKMTAARNDICRVIFHYPSSRFQSRLRLMLALLLVDNFPEKSSTAALIADSALLFENKTTTIDETINTLSTSSKARLQSCNKESLRWASKAVFIAPNSANAWSALIGSIVNDPAAICTLKTATRVRDAISFVRRQLQPARHLGQWLSNHERRMETIIRDLSKVL